MENVLETVFISLWLKDAKLEVLVAPSCLTLCNPMNYSQSGSSANGILQTGILERVAIPFSGGSSRPRDRTCVSCVERQILDHLNHVGSPICEGK